MEVKRSVKIFETDRLTVNSFTHKDKEYFIELLSDSEIIDAIPQPKLDDEKILEKFYFNLGLNGRPIKGQENIYGIFEKDNPNMIGLCALLTNDENDWKLAYRLRQKYWKKGYGTETTKGLIDYCFSMLEIDKVTADVNIENIASLKILNKFMTPEVDFFNSEDNCTDRRYTIEKSNWLP